MDYTECIHYTVRACRALKRTPCEKYCKKCNFRQDKEQAEASEQKARARLMSLPAEYQKAIAEKYYRGEMPWRALK